MLKNLQIRCSIFYYCNLRNIQYYFIIGYIAFIIGNIIFGRPEYCMDLGSEMRLGLPNNSSVWNVSDISENGNEIKLIRVYAHSSIREELTLLRDGPDNGENSTWRILRGDDTISVNSSVEGNASSSPHYLASLLSSEP